MTTSNIYPVNQGNIGAYVDDVGTYPFVAILTSGYVYDDAHEDLADVVSAEISGTGYSRVTISGVTFTTTDGVSTLEADDFTFAALTDTAIDGCIIASDQGVDSASPVVCHLAFSPTDRTSEAVPFDLPAGVLVTYENADPDVATVAGVSPDSTGDVPAATLATALGVEISGVAVPALNTGSPYDVLRQNDAGSALEWVGNAVPSFIYNSSGSQAGFRYNNWADLMTAVAAADQPKEILFEQDETIPTTGMPTDGWHLNGARLTSDDTGVPADRPIVTFPDGCKLDPAGLGLLLGDTVTLRSDSTSPVITLDSTGIQVVNLGDLVMMMSTAEVFIYCNNAGGVFIVSLGSVSSLRTISSYNTATGASETGSDHPVIGFNAGALNLVTTTHASAYIEAETVEGAANVTFSHNHAWPDSYETKITAASQTGISGSVLYDKKPGATSMVFTQTTTGHWTVADGSSVADTLDEVGSRLSDVEDPATIAYTPNNGTHWVDTDPANVQDALDRMASLLYTLNSNTAIPS